MPPRKKLRIEGASPFLPVEDGYWIKPEVVVALRAGRKACEASSGAKCHQLLHSGHSERNNASFVPSCTGSPLCIEAGAVTLRVLEETILPDNT